MPERRDSELVEDIADAIAKIQRYVSGKTYADFLRDSMVLNAVVRNLEIIGETVEGMSADIRKKHKVVKWQDIAGMRGERRHRWIW
ncbi:MAG: DUF86 domain-containing protein [Alphaproteobacteria bacterium]|nr:DUF86 domain-containing protein [Alphaproteobacteria bacterium]